MVDLVDVGKAIVRARSCWNRTGILLTPGEQFVLSANGRWVDFFLCHGPAGDPSPGIYMRLFERYKRIPSANWFALIGALDCDLNTAFLIGNGTDVTVQAAGELTCFANDVACMYWNNWGHVELVVKRYVRAVGQSVLKSPPSRL